MNFLDVTYIVCCDFYRSREKDIFKESGLILLGAVFMMNLMLLTFITEDFFYLDIFISYSSEQMGWVMFGVSIFFVLPLLYFRYFRITNYTAIHTKINGWSDQ